MYLDQEVLGGILVNKYAVVIVGKLTETDRIAIRNGLNIYNENKFYVGECHVEARYFKNMTRGLRSIYGITADTAVLFFKNGFLEHVKQGVGDLFWRSEELYQILINDLDIRLV